ncbi:MAG: AI-2E family transporter [Arsenophonus sp.]|nr:MAG: AI-2E family transporter [Arsenophonus sp.]
MLEKFVKYYYRKIFDAKFIKLIFIFILIFSIMFLFNNMLTPLFIVIVLTYLLEYPVQKIENFGLSRTISVSVILMIFIGISIMVILVMMPIIWQQAINLILDLPSMANIFNQNIKLFSENHPIFVNAGIVDIIINNLRTQLSNLGKSFIKYSFSSLIEIITFLMYLVLVPLIVFFLLKDKIKIFFRIKNFLYFDYIFFKNIWKEINQQIRKYIQGKVIEMMIVGISTYLVFIFLNMNYSLFLSVLVGMSVFIPYIGAIFVSIPVILVGLFQWGFSSDFWTLFISYIIIQTIDGNILVPILFSEVINLHPLIIIFSIIFFGGLLGFWGVFFAIPLAIFIKSIINVYLRQTILF